MSDNNTGALMVIDALFESVAMPVTPQTQGRKNSRAYKYYRRVRPEFPAWWEEFNTAVNNNTRKYVSIAKFIYSRTTNKEEQGWLMEMIGPAPLLNEKRDAPWLGDWYARRLNGSFLPEQLDKVKNVVDAIKQEQNIIRSMQPLSAQLIARNLRMKEQIDEAFAGQMFIPESDPMEAGNLARAKMFLEINRLVDVDLYRAMEEMYASNLINRKNVDKSATVEINNQVNQHIESQEITTENQQLLLIAQQLQYHSNKLRMPLPETLEPKAKTVEALPVKKEKIQ